MKYVFLTIALIQVCLAQGTRSLKLIAKDQKGIPQEVSLYQKTHTVIIDIHRNKNLDFNLQPKNAVSDAKGVKNVLEVKFAFDKTLQRKRLLKTLQAV